MHERIYKAHAAQLTAGNAGFATRDADTCNQRGLTLDPEVKWSFNFHFRVLIKH